LSSVPAGRWPFPALSPRIFPRMLGPIPRCFPWCTYPFLPGEHRPSLPRDRLGSTQRSVQRLLYGGDFRGYRSFTHVQACGFARHPGPSYRSVSTGQPWLVRPSILRFVTSPHIGYANRPNRAIDGVGTCTPLDSRPCRPLPPRPSPRETDESSAYPILSHMSRPR
jgi:hypothetical protein